MVNSPPANAEDLRDMGSIPGLGRSPEEGHGNPFQYSCLENPMDRRARWAAVYGVARSQTRLSDFTSISWLPTFAFQSPVMKRTSFGVLVLEDLVGLHGTIHFQLLQHYWLGHRLRLPWYWMVCLGNEPRWFCRFWNFTQVLHFGLLLTLMATPFLLRDSCLQ